MAPNEWKCGVVEEDENGKYKLNEEIRYGISLRKSRNQEKQILLAQDQYSTHSSEKEKIPPYSRPTKRFKRKPKKSKKHKTKSFALLPTEDADKPTVVDRYSCTRKEYIDILSTPRKYVCVEEPKKKQPALHPASPRFAQLAIPLKKRAYNTWLNYHKLLKPEQIISLQNYLTKEEALDPKDARDYFKRLDRKKKIEKKIKKKKQCEKELVKKPQKSKLYKEINRLAKMIVTHFTSKQQQAVKCVHVMLTDLMKHHLEKENCIPCCCKRNRDKDVYSKTLFDALDQLSVWLEGNVGYENLIDSDEEEEEEKSIEESSYTYSSESEAGMSGESAFVYKTEMEDYDKKKAGMEDKLLAEFEELGRTRPEGLRFAEKQSYYDDKGTDKDSRLGAQASESASEKFDMGAMDKIMDSEDLGDAEVNKWDLESRAISDGDVIINVDEMESGVSVAAEQELAKEEAYRLQEGLLSDIMQTMPEEEAEAVGEKRPPIEEHSPGAVCCVTIKTWTKWLVDVSHNTHHWCQWIQDVIARVRFFAAVIKGEVTMPDGRKRILYKEEWDHFTETLDKDIEAWHQYNEHVKGISENIINEFQNKRIICCPACVNSKLIIDEESAHQVTDQLVQALNTTSYWRSWLDTIVTEAQKLKDLSFALSPSTGEDESGTSSLGYFELVELKTPSPQVTTTMSSSEDGSMFDLLEIEKEPPEKK